MSTTSRATSSQSLLTSSSSCTCCNCAEKTCSQDNIPGNQDICFVEGTDLEKSQSLETQAVSKKVWANVKPPTNFGMQQSIVSARRTEIVRAQLTRNTKSKKDDVLTPPHKKNVRRTKSKTSYSKVSLTTITR